jgi:uncharacterized damage-inducible protein DinB
MKRNLSRMNLLAGALSVLPFLVLAFLVLPMHAQQTSVSMSAAAKQQYNGLKRNILAAAEKMPEDAYAFQPTKEERSFGAWVAHVADAQIGTCSGIAGTPKSIDAASKTSKADLEAALKQSFEVCDAVYDGLTDANAADPVNFRRSQQPRVIALFSNIAHDQECYGSMAVYMRLKGVVPPSSEPKS